MLKPVGRGRDIDPAALATAKHGVKYRQSSLLPGITLIGRPSGNYFVCRWVTPIDAERTFYYSFSLFRRRGVLRNFANRLFWVVWLSWAHDWIFSDQDKRVLDKVIAGEEMLSRSDIGVVAWRRFAATHARRPPGFAAASEEITQSAAE